MRVSGFAGAGARARVGEGERGGAGATPRGCGSSGDDAVVDSANLKLNERTGSLGTFKESVGGGELVLSDCDWTAISGRELRLEASGDHPATSIAKSMLV